MKPLPRSKAKTAYGLISDVIRAMVAEPKRVDMDVWLVNVDPKDGGPACGTVGCFAGWVSILKDGASNQYAEDHARQLLGSCNYYTAPGAPADEEPYDRYVFNGSGPDIKGEPGTKRYMRSVVARIKRFQKINAKYLRSRAV